MSFHQRWLLPIFAQFESHYSFCGGSARCSFPCICLDLSMVAIFLGPSDIVDILTPEDVDVVGLGRGEVADADAGLAKVGKRRAVPQGHVVGPGAEGAAALADYLDRYWWIEQQWRGSES
jgi:hypothetical protein